MSRCFLALGSNLGDRLEHLEAALPALEGYEIRVLRTASVYSTEPREILDQPWFLNTAVEVETGLEPETLMRACLEIEGTRGRRRELPSGPRTLDIDIVLFENRVVRTPSLEIPHPRYAERRFVLEPLAEIASDRMDPVRNLTVGQLLGRLADDASVTIFAPPLMR